MLRCADIVAPPKKGPTAAELQAKLAACLQKRDYPGAVAAFELLLKVGTPSSQTRMRYADTLLLAGKKGAAVQEYFRVAEEMAETGYLVQAVAVYKKIVKIDPAHSGVLERLARLDAERSASSAAAPARSAPRTASPGPTTTPGPRFDFESADDMQDLDIGAELGLGQPAAPAPAPAGPPAAQARQSPPAPVARVSAPAPAAAPTAVEPELGDDLSMDDLEDESLVAPDVAPEFAPGVSPEATPVSAPVPTGFAGSAGIPEQEPPGFLADELDAMLDGIMGDVGRPAAEAPVQLGRAETNIGLFSHLAIDELVEVLKLLDWQTARAGQVIVRAGDPGHSMFIVSSGVLEATVPRAGTMSHVATFRDGDFFGEMAMLSGEPRSATVTAKESAELLELSRERMDLLLSRHPEIEAKLRLAHDERRERNLGSSRA